MLLLFIIEMDFPYFRQTIGRKGTVSKGFTLEKPNNTQAFESSVLYPYFRPKECFKQQKSILNPRILGLGR